MKKRFSHHLPNKCGNFSFGLLTANTKQQESSIRWTTDENKASQLNHMFRNTEMSMKWSVAMLITYSKSSHDTKQNIGTDMNKPNWNYGVHICIINKKDCIKNNKYYKYKLQWLEVFVRTLWFGYFMIWNHAHKHTVSLPMIRQQSCIHRCQRAEQADKTLKWRISQATNTQLRLTAPLPAELLQFEMKGADTLQSVE